MLLIGKLHNEEEYSDWTIVFLLEDWRNWRQLIYIMNKIKEAFVQSIFPVSDCAVSKVTIEGSAN